MRKEEVDVKQWDALYYILEVKLAYNKENSSEYC